jgi:DNA-binding response OmpR family regulator
MDASGGDLNVLIVEDEVIARHALASLLSAVGYATCAVGTAEMAVQHIKDGELPEIALVDLDLPGMSGADFIAYLNAEHPKIFSILITAAGADRVSRLRHKAMTYLPKPLDFRELVRVLEAHNRSHESA